MACAIYGHETVEWHPVYHQIILVVTSSDKALNMYNTGPQTCIQHDPALWLVVKLLFGHVTCQTINTICVHWQHLTTALDIVQHTTCTCILDCTNIYWNFIFINKEKWILSAINCGKKNLLFVLFNRMGSNRLVSPQYCSDTTITSMLGQRNVGSSVHVNNMNRLLKEYLGFKVLELLNPLKILWGDRFPVLSILQGSWELFLVFLAFID